MAATPQEPSSSSSQSGGGSNFYSLAKNNPEVLEKRQRATAELDAKVQYMLAHNPGRVPCWEPQRLMQMDRFCLEQGKRCIMWDDEGAGFYLMLNWDWLSNRPARPGRPEEALQPGWWHNAKQLLRPPLLDPSLPDDRVAAWVDAHTMRVHNGFLHLLPKLRREAETQQLVLDDPYWKQLQQIPAAQRQPAAPPRGSCPASAAVAPAGAAAATAPRQRQP